MSDLKTIINSLENLEIEIKKNEKETSVIEGKVSGMLDQLKALGIKSEEEAKKTIESIQEKILADKTQVETEYKALREEYEW